jgi:SSS family solute:Na+ symporter
MVYGTWTAYGVSSPVQSHFGGPLASFPGTDTKVYIAVVAFLLNVALSVLLTAVFRVLKVPDGVDQTRPSDYTADEGDPRVEPQVDPARPAHA